MTEELRALDGVVLWAEAPLAPLTTIGTGGSADLLVTVSGAATLVATLKIVETHRVPGSAWGQAPTSWWPTRIPGVVIKLDDGFNYVEGMPSAPVSGPERVSVLAGPGFVGPIGRSRGRGGIVRTRVRLRIPGTVGGGIPMNAGAYGCCLADVVEEVEMATASGLRRLCTKAMDWAIVPADCLSRRWSRRFASDSPRATPAPSWNSTG